MKFQYFLNSMEESKAKYIILVDSMDLFFCRDSKIFLKQIKQRKHIICGAERYLYYPNGKHDINNVENFFKRIATNNNVQTQLFYPNSGFIAGKRLDLINLIKCHLNYEDDQVALYDTILENKHHIDLDYHSEFVGNFGVAKGDNNKQYWDVDELGINNKLGQYPVAMHFPGRNYGAMHETYARLNNNYNMYGNGYVLLLCLGILVVSLILIVIIVRLLQLNGVQRFMQTI